MAQPPISLSAQRSDLRVAAGIVALSWRYLMRPLGCREAATPLARSPSPSIWLARWGPPGAPSYLVIGVKSPCATRTPLTEITVVQARFPEIMSWEDWKAKARSLEPRCCACGSPAKDDEREVHAATGRCQACAAKSEPLASALHELCKCS